MSQDWELLADSPLAGAIERLNLSALDAAVETLVLACLRDAHIPDESDLKHLHRVATYRLLRRPGHYRRTQMHLQDEQGYASDDLRPPLPRDVPKLMRGFGRELAARWNTGDALDVAAFCLWRILNIHPFRNGNGRAATAFAYACLCIKLGGVLPGRPTLLQQQAANSVPSYAALTVAHRSFAKAKRARLGPLKAYLDELLLRQMKTARRPGRARRSKSR